MWTFPLTYEEPVFRPPAEAGSFIFQLTSGCSWNKCSFCEMYTSKQFKIKKTEIIIEEIRKVAPFAHQIRKVFLADGNAFVLNNNQLLPILKEINLVFPKLQRISAYALPSDISRKSNDELLELHNAGLSLLYVGVESGDDSVLSVMNKSETAQSTLEGLLKAQSCGFELSVMILNGLGGKAMMQQHAINSAKIINAIKPKYLSTLVLSYPFGIDHFKKRIASPFEALTTLQLIEEMGIFLEHTTLDSTIFRSDHASNYLVLKGILGRDKEKLMESIRFVLQNPNDALLRSEWIRGL